jgi:hypothetical protein
VSDKKQIKRFNLFKIKLLFYVRNKMGLFFIGQAFLLNFFQDATKTTSSRAEYWLKPTSIHQLHPASAGWKLQKW